MDTRLSFRLPHHRAIIREPGYEASSAVASTLGRLLGEERPCIDCLRMRRVFRILSNKLDRKLNHPRRDRTILRSRANIYGTIIMSYEEFTESIRLPGFRINMRKESIPGLPSTRRRPGVEASSAGAEGIAS